MPSRHETEGKSYPEGLSVVLPAFNEDENIEAALNKCLQALVKLNLHFEVIIVDDGSRDNTSKMVQEAAEREPRIKLIRHKVNRGYGTAIRTGLNAAQYHLTFFTDSDNQFDISEIRYLIPLMDSYDVVTGFRVYRYDTVLRCILSWAYNKLVRMAFGVKVRDVDCSFKLIKKKVIDNIDLTCSNFFIDTEILVKARAAGFSINEMGVRHYPRTAGSTTVRPSDIPNTLRELLRMWKDIHFGKAKK